MTLNPNDNIRIAYDYLPQIFEDIRSCLNEDHERRPDTVYCTYTLWNKRSFTLTEFYSYIQDIKRDTGKSLFDIDPFLPFKFAKMADREYHATGSSDTFLSFLPEAIGLMLRESTKYKASLSTLFLVDYKSEKNTLRYFSKLNELGIKPDSALARKSIEIHLKRHHTKAAKMILDQIDLNSLKPEALGSLMGTIIGRPYYKNGHEYLSKHDGLFNEISNSVSLKRLSNTDKKQYLSAFLKQVLFTHYLKFPALFMQNPLKISINTHIERIGLPMDVIQNCLTGSLQAVFNDDQYRILHQYDGNDSLDFETGSYNARQTLLALESIAPLNKACVQFLKTTTMKKIESAMAELNAKGLKFDIKPGRSFDSTLSMGL